MDGALSWLSWIASWVAQFIPQWEVLDPTLAWMKFRRGQLHSCGRGGIVIWWPVVTKVEIHSVAEQTIKLEPQSLMTHDAATITVRGVIVYEYEDLEKMAVTTADPDDSVRDKALMVVAYTVAQHNKESLLTAFRHETLDEDMRRKAQLLLGRKYGVRVLRMGLIELTMARPYRLIAGGSTDTTLPMVPVV